jgi:hypothetical protein
VVSVDAWLDLLPDREESEVYEHLLWHMDSEGYDMADHIVKAACAEVAAAAFEAGGEPSESDVLDAMLRYAQEEREASDES